jgi:fructokinase
VAFALAQLAHTLVLSVAPQRILIGGGVAGEQPQLFARIRTFLRQSINNYVDIERAVGSLEDYITPPGLGALAGPLGALAVGADAAARCRGESISMPGYEQ